MADLNKIIAPAFDPTEEYEKNDCVLYNNKLYKLVADDYVAGEFDVDEWEKVYLFNFIGTGNNGEIISSGYDWKNWCTMGGVSYLNYTSLIALLNDEVAIRRIMTKHFSADYLYSWLTIDESMLNIITISENAMKWIGLRDYICDKLMSNDTIKEAMLNSDYWEYILKDHVPKLTSDDSTTGTSTEQIVQAYPYGKVITSSINTTSKHRGFYIFDGHTPHDDFGDGSGSQSYYHSMNDSAFPQYAGYQFTNPICVKRVWVVAMYSSTYGNCRLKEFKIQASNDNSTWVDLTETLIYPNEIKNNYYVDLNNDNYYLSYRIYALSCYDSNYKFAIDTLQFYGRSLNISVPVMSSNTAPYGTVFQSTQSTCSAIRDWYGWHAFGSDSINGIYSNSNTGGSYVGYDFKRKFIIKNIFVCAKKLVANFTFEGSNNGTDWDILYTHEESDFSGSTYVSKLISISTDTAYRYYRLNNLQGNQTWIETETGYIFYLRECNFYSVDYSEREFEEGSNIKCLYDHGIEFETLSLDYTNVGTNKAYKTESSLVTSNIGNGSSIVGAKITTPLMDISSYNRFRMILGQDNLVGSNTTNNILCNMVASVTSPYEYNVSSWAVYTDIVMNKGNIPYHCSIDISGLTGNYSVGFGAYQGSTSYTYQAEVAEMWLE